MKKIVLTLLLLVTVFTVSDAQQRQHRKRERRGAILTGYITDASTGDSLGYASVVLHGTTLMAIANDFGYYRLDHIPEGFHTIRVSLAGYSPASFSVELKEGEMAIQDIKLVPDVVALDQIVISASRTEVVRRNSPGLVNVMTSGLIEQTNAFCLAEALPFQPGVRVENQCQNCGFNQVRINGLDGHYSQILIDSRPVFSALAGVYGLEQIPANMIDRVEVLRGGGSALYGSSAIGGTINIITRDPVTNDAEVAHTITTIGGGKAWDNNTTFNTSLVTGNGKAGFLAYGQKRSRQGYDHTGDGFTELPEIRSNTIGFRTNFKMGLNAKLALQYHGIGEYRRGGNKLERPPHEADIAEQLEHQIHGGGVSYDLFSSDYSNRLNLFTSMQYIDRKSYYGAGQDPQAYGTTKDMTVVSGIQYTHKWERLWFMPAEFVSGMEYNYNGLYDRYLGYDSETHQIIHDVSLYVQNEWRNDRWGFLAGVRADKHNLIDHVIFSPRVNVRFNPTRNVNFRTSYSTGFRAPQAFDEDFHVAVVGGDRVVTVLADDLKEEKSGSFSFSADLYHSFGKVQTNLIVELFHNRLRDVFALRMLDHKDKDGNRVLERYNGSGAVVKGMNVEGKAILSSSFQVQAGITYQKSTYIEPEQWSENPSVAPVTRIFRCPDLYGYLTSTLTLPGNFNVSVSGKYTGSMIVQHFVGSGTSVDEAVTTPSFLDMDLRLVYDIRINRRTGAQINAGIKNVFDSYQSDFDKGPERDSGYVYGPMKPRNYFVGLKFSF
ncbi:MAG: TonB-dependent receptor [Bacteroidales bacterium]|jgi:outer membrane receptor for ferrienterochelin and colicins|nr:TonB-dependent receptor [Bacteroidales bacterium]MDD2263805.1 TonB-dependent receptor [Bacteroidales bacterium]MDD2830977.1 TonB-dependent receptor [Bacteroidales bacterium]MDD3208215.1 TonB-dependent receptor [Bacteroidales bacterium]MDD3696743.1 TonB-dependent receptor [Bacteroidales bacterium]